MINGAVYSLKLGQIQLHLPLRVGAGGEPHGVAEQDSGLHVAADRHRRVRHRPRRHGRAVQVGPIKPKLKAPGTKRLNLICGRLLSILHQFCFQIRLVPLHHGAHPTHLRAPHRVLDRLREDLPGRLVATSHPKISEPSSALTKRALRQYGHLTKETAPKAFGHLPKQPYTITFTWLSKLY
jgi:hypothetical protein